MSLCFCLLMTTESMAKVCFVGDDDCAQGGDFGKYEDPAADGSACISEGYILKSECTGNRHAVSYCPYNSDYVMCCGNEYVYDSCVYPYSYVGKCGNKYACDCDSNVYKYTQADCEADNAYPAGASCTRIAANSDGTSTIKELLYTTCMCQRGTYTYDKKTCDVNRGELSGEKCTDSDGNEYYSKCTCGYTQRVDDCEYGSVGDNYCISGGLIYVDSCCSCDGFPVELVNGKPSKGGVNLNKVVDGGWDVCPCSKGKRRVKITQCQQGWVPTEAGDGCERVSCDLAVKRYLATHPALANTYAIFTGNKMVSYEALSDEELEAIEDKGMRSYAVGDEMEMPNTRTGIVLYDTPTSFVYKTCLPVKAKGTCSCQSYSTNINDKVPQPDACTVDVVLNGSNTGTSFNGDAAVIKDTAVSSNGSLVNGGNLVSGGTVVGGKPSIGGGTIIGGKPIIGGGTTPYYCSSWKIDYDTTGDRGYGFGCTNATTLISAKEFATLIGSDELYSCKLEENRPVIKFSGAIFPNAKKEGGNALTLNDIDVSTSTDTSVIVSSFKNANIYASASNKTITFLKPAYLESNDNSTFGSLTTSYVFKESLTSKNYNFKYNTLGIEVPVYSISGNIITLPSGGTMMGNKLQIYLSSNTPTYTTQPAPMNNSYIEINGPSGTGAQRATVYSDVYVGYKAKNYIGRGMYVQLRGNVDLSLYNGSTKYYIYLTPGSSVKTTTINGETPKIKRTSSTYWSNCTFKTTFVRPIDQRRFWTCNQPEMRCSGNGNINYWHNGDGTEEGTINNRPIGRVSSDGIYRLVREGGTVATSAYQLYIGQGRKGSDGSAVCRGNVDDYVMPSTYLYYDMQIGGGNTDKTTSTIKNCGRPMNCE